MRRPLGHTIAHRAAVARLALGAVLVATGGRATAAASTTAAWPAAADTAPRAPTPCATSAEARRMDFWIGAWEVRTRDGRTAGRDVVERVAGGCGLHERWQGRDGGTGMSLSAYNPVTRQWQQLWVGQLGAVTEYRRSEWRDRSLVLLADTRQPDGTPSVTRMTFTPMSVDVVRQHFERSTDGGRTFATLADFEYHRERAETSPPM